MSQTIGCRPVPETEMNFWACNPGEEVVKAVHEETHSFDDVAGFGDGGSGWRYKGLPGQSRLLHQGQGFRPDQGKLLHGNKNRLQGNSTKTGAAQTQSCCRGRQVVLPMPCVFL